MGKNRMEAFSDGVLAIIAAADDESLVARLWLVPHRRIEKRMTAS